MVQAAAGGNINCYRASQHLHQQQQQQRLAGARTRPIILSLNAPSSRYREHNPTPPHLATSSYLTPHQPEAVASEEEGNLGGLLT